MCVEAVIRNGPVCYQAGELSQALGVPIIKADGYRRVPEDEDCLCGVDVPAMAAEVVPPMSCKTDEKGDYRLDF